MRLLHTESLVVEDFTSRKTPEYVILSHRWSDNEVSFQELRCFTETDSSRQAILAAVFDVDLSGPRSKTNGKGWQKIQRACSFALSHGFNWIWIDTCCINRESSAELSEAINSMYKWYRNAAMCYAYLSDVSIEEGVMREFKQTEWFSRGWTLQELLAPRILLFLDTDFNLLGSKDNLAADIEAVTGISANIVTGQVSVHEESIATRMSWAAHRRTTRSEDIAYCLLGIFNINMPLLYGEGFVAFRRLQEAIISSSDDETIFAHTFATYSPPSALAHHPRNFRRHKKVIRGLPARFLESEIGSSSYSMTNKGVEMCPVYISLTPDSSSRAILLNCRFEFDNYPIIIPISLIKSEELNLPALLPAWSRTWRIRLHSDYDENIKQTKALIDATMRHLTPTSKPVNTLFKTDTIYLR